MSAPELSPEEQRIVARFDAAPYPAEVLLSHLQTPSADTETLRRVREAADLLTRDADESSDVIARLAYRDAANRIRAALDAR